MDSDSASKVPKSLERLLTVTGPPSTGVTSAVEPSSLLAKLDSFLPKLKEANSRLEQTEHEKLNSIPAPEPVQIKEEKDDVKNEDEDSEDDELVVNMDVYLDNTLGELVPNAETANQDKSQGKKNPLIEVVESSNTAEDEITTT